MKRYQLLSITSPSVEFEIGDTIVQSTVIKNTKKNPNFTEALLFVDTVCSPSFQMSIFVSQAKYRNDK